MYFIYDGPVKSFDHIVCRRWEANTVADSEKKARSNLIFRYKKEHGLMPNAKISLPGELQRGE